eukprot:2154534-Rhodomonas_salina.1
MQDIAQTVDMAHCKMPDFYMSDVYRCSCGDTAVVVAEQRKQEGVLENAFWCAGFLRMLSEEGAEVYVYNRHTLKELTEVMQTQDVDRYLLCVARPFEFRQQYPQFARSSCEALRPSLPDIEMQGVETMA